MQSWFSAIRLSSHEESLKEILRGKKLKSHDAVFEAVQEWIKMQLKYFFASGIKQLPKRWNKCIAVAGGGGLGL